MAMTTAELQRYLDPKKIGSAPILVKLGVLLVVLAGIVAASWYFDWQDQLDKIEREAKKETGLRETFLTKKKEAINLAAYQKQLEDIEKQFGALLTDINQASLGRGLQFELFKPAAGESRRDFYAELPITIKITGNYHDIGAFASDISKLSRIVTLNDVGLTGGAKGGLVFDATAKTFRYLDDTEVAAQRKAAAPSKKKK